MATNASRVKMVDQYLSYRYRPNRFTYLTVIPNVKVKPKGTKFHDSQRISLVVVFQLSSVKWAYGRICDILT